MKTYTENELKNKAEAYCSAAERCPSEVMQKLKQWGADEDVQMRILASLEADRFIDSSRYCRAFVRDKYRFAHWGRTKIAQALRMKGLSAEDISAGLGEIDEEEYASILRDVLNRKQKTVTGKNEYERSLKLLRFAISRGFTVEETRRYVDQCTTDEFMD